MVRLNPRRAVVLALEIAVDSLAAAIVGLGGEVLAHARVDRQRGHTSVEQIAADLAELADGVSARVPRHATTIAIGVAIVAVVRRDDGLVRMAPNLGWVDVPLGDRLAAVLDTDWPIFVANEADLGALAEHRRGAAVEADHVLYISGEVGVGGGIIVGGQPLTGVAGYGGEIGHIPVNPNGLDCHCGSIGCWETEVGERALLRRAGHPVDGGGREVEAVLAEAAAGDPTAVAALEAVGGWLGTGLAGLVNIFNPELVVLGGLLGRIHPFVAPTVERTIDRLALPASRSLVRLVPARLGVDAPLLGAAELALEPLVADPAAWFGRVAVPELATA
jgi:predicted NBD/HSP70 family sugar kinase